MTTSLNRRSLVKGAAWAAPAVAATTAIPAYAASRISAQTCVQTKTFDWSKSFTRHSEAGFAKTNHNGYGTSDGLTVTAHHVAHTAKAFGSINLLPAGANTFGWGTVPNSYGGLNTGFIYLQTLQSGKNGYSGGTQNTTLTLTFSEPLYNLQFDLLDVDKGSTLSGGAWEDHITISGAAHSFTAVGSTAQVRGQEVIGTSDAGTSGAGNVRVHFAGPVTSISINWKNGGLSGAQNIGLSPLTYCSAKTMGYNSSVG